MPAVRASRLASATVIFAVVSDLFTVPAGQRWKVKWISLMNGGAGGANRVTFSSVDAGVLRQAGFFGVVNDSQLQVPLDWVFNEGSTLRVQQSNAGGITFVLVHGFIIG